MPRRLCSRCNRSRTERYRSCAFLFFRPIPVYNTGRKGMALLRKDTEKKTKYTFFQNARYMAKLSYTYGRAQHHPMLRLTVNGILPSVLTPLLGAYVLKVMIDCVSGPVTWEQLLVSLVLFAGGSIACEVIRKKYEFQLMSFGDGLRYSMLKTILAKSLTVPYEDVENRDRRKIFEDAVSTVWWGDLGVQNFWSSLIQMLVSLTGIVSFFAILAVANPWLILICLIAGAINFAVALAVSRINRESQRQFMAARNKALYFSCGKASDLKSAKDVKLYHIAGWFSPLLDLITGDYRRYLKGFNRKSLLLSTIQLLIFCVRDLGVFAILALLYDAGELTAGDFIFYYSIIQGANAWLRQFAEQYGVLYEKHLMADDYRKCTEKEENTGNGEALEAMPGRCTVTFEDVSLSYDGAHNAVSHLSFRVSPGEKIAIVGENGAGKTSAMKLLCGLYAPTSGRIRINGRDAGELADNERFQLFSAIFQDVFLLPASLETNVTMQEESRTDAGRLAEALQLAGLNERVAQLPDGVKTRLGKEVDSNAVDLSGGETQKLLLARAIYKQAPIIILDEPTAALDPIAENELYMKYNEITQNRTSFYISHRLASTAFCDRILFLENGKIVETGTHDQLMEQKGKYFRMYSMQSYYYNEEPGGGIGDEKAI